MKNLVKITKSKQWISIVSGLIFSSVLFSFLYLFIFREPIDKSNTFVLAAFRATFIFVVFMSLGFGYAVHLAINELLWRDVRKRKRELMIIRNVHHIRLIEKCIDNDLLQKSEKFLESYSTAPYANELLIHYFHGAIKSKFYLKLDIKLLSDGDKIYDLR